MLGFIKALDEIDLSAVGRRRTCLRFIPVVGSVVIVVVRVRVAQWRWRVSDRKSARERIRARIKCATRARARVCELDSPQEVFDERQKRSVPVDTSKHLLNRHDLVSNVRNALRVPRPPRPVELFFVREEAPTVACAKQRVDTMENRLERVNVGGETVGDKSKRVRQD